MSREFYELSRVCEKFVEYATEKFDDSHGMSHMRAVVRWVKKIVRHDKTINGLVRQFP